jgi:hypothetical protein
MKSVMKKNGEAAEAVAVEQLCFKARRVSFEEKRTCHC